MQAKNISISFSVLIVALIFGLSVFMVWAQEDSLSEKPKKPALEEQKFEKPMPVEEPKGQAQEPSPEEPKMQNVDKREMSDFQREMKDLVRESKKLLGDLKKVKDSQEWQQTISEIIKNASSCASKVLTLPAEDRRSHIDDCRSERYWDSMQEIRDEFVPPQDIKNAMNDVKRQLKELANYKKQILKAAADTDTSKIDQLVSQINGHKTNIESSKGRDQKDALQEFWGNNYWDEINKLRAQVELPKELKQILKEIAFAEKDSKARNVQKAFEFFGLDYSQLAKLVTAKKESIAQIQSLANNGDFEAASELMQESIHEGWHPGDLRHFMGMMRETHERMKNIKDDQILEQILAIMEPIGQSFMEEDVRGARDAMVEFTDQMRKYESLFRPYYRGGVKELSKKTLGALDKLEGLIQKKLEKGELKKTPEPQDNEPQKTENGGENVPSPAVEQSL
ncbi:hypothetical protein HY621_00405 [Candidatus Uhrbacteria bacterium]|nr:hypothetical protein [Candidatus Uhrbacteria bacterium]